MGDRWFDLSEKETQFFTGFWWEPKSFRGNSADFYYDNIFTYYSGLKAAAIKKEWKKVYYDRNITCCGENQVRLNSSLGFFLIK